MRINAIGLYTFVAREIERFLRTFIQSIFSPWISAVLYIVIFGFVVGSRIDRIAGVAYIDFVLPGIVMLNLITGAFSQTSFSLYFQRFAKHIEEILISPLSHLEMIVAYVVGGVARAVLVGVGVYGIALFFTSATIEHFGLFLLYVMGVSIIFSLLGLLVGLWSESFEHLSILNTFVIMPLIFLGGVFNSLAMLPERARLLVRFNPFFYFVDGLRFAMIGVRESNLIIGAVIIVGLIVVLGALVWYLFKVGWKLRS